LNSPAAVTASWIPAEASASFTTSTIFSSDMFRLYRGLATAVKVLKLFWLPRPELQR
jgi:hypothetical protein